jgi:hypothetical protein
VTSTFISYSTENRSTANRIEQDLVGSGLGAWIDHSEIRVGNPLVDAIQQGLEQCACVALLWSRPASESRYVKLEWQAAIQIDKPIIPCRLDDTELPLLLRSILYCDFRVSYEDGARKLLDALGNPLPLPQPVPVTQTASLTQPIARLQEGQQAVIAALVQEGSPAAAALQERLDPFTTDALKQWPGDAMVLNLAGYREKNVYMIKHWKEIQERKSPQDGLLEQAEKFFHASLSVIPNDPSAINGLASVLLLRRDLDAAEFFVRRALDRAQAQHFRYVEAEQDLETILRLKDELKG